MTRNGWWAMAGAGTVVLIVMVAFSSGPQTEGPQSDQIAAPAGPVIVETPAAPITIDPHAWTREQKSLLATLSLKALPPLPPDPSNAYADNPVAAHLGHKLFFDMRFSSNGLVSCASCHKPELMFTDGLARAKGVGITPRKSMTIVGVAYSNWFFWDGRKDSLWSQALGPTENPLEHAGNRSQFAHLLYEDADYRSLYEALFGPHPDISDEGRYPRSAGPAPVPGPEASEAWAKATPEDQDTINRIFANMGKAIAAYERLLMPGPGRLDAYIDAALSGDRAGMELQLSEAEAQGLQLFTGRAQCINCHNGPLLTNHSFHNTGIPPAPDLPPDLGRSEGIMLVMEDPFNCTGKYSDANEGDCAHLRFARTEGVELISAFKVPTLRNISKTAPYMHSGQIANLTDALKHYNEAPLAIRGHSEIEPLNLTPVDLQNLEAFLRALDSPLTTPPELLVPPVSVQRDSMQDSM